MATIPNADAIKDLWRRYDATQGLDAVKWTQRAGEIWDEALRTIREWHLLPDGRLTYSIQLKAGDDYVKLAVALRQLHPVDVSWVPSQGQYGPGTISLTIARPRE